MLLHLMCKSSCNIWYTAMVSSFHGFFSSSDSPSSLLILRRSCHTLFNWMASLQYDSLHESSPQVKKLLSHLVHFNGCFLHGSSDISLSLFEKILPHLMHLYGFSPVWFLSWILTWCGKAPVTFGALQWLFPSRTLWWYFKYLDQKLLPHFMHLNGFSPVWFLSWIVTLCGNAS